MLKNKSYCFLLLFVLLGLQPVAAYGPVGDAGEYDALFDVKTNATLFAPTTVADVQKVVKQAHDEKAKVCIVGAGKSQGGQTMCDGAKVYRVSLHKLNKMLSLDTQKKVTTVQAGMTWGQLQKHIAPHGLAVKSMQSFNSFSIGGSLGVNPHCQDFHAGPVIRTVKSIKMILPTSELVEVSREKNAELFRLAIGGYGLLGIIVEVTIDVTDDILVDRKTVTMPTSELASYFLYHVKNNPAVEFYGARFSLESESPLEEAIVVTYEKSDKAPEDNAHLFEYQPESLRTRIGNEILRDFGVIFKMSSWLKEWRFALEQRIFKRPRTMSRNNFMGFSIDCLPQDTWRSQYILQEYFIPYPQLTAFMGYLSQVVSDYHINLLNITARHIPCDQESFMSISPTEDRCALVLYINVLRDSDYYTSTVEWTRKLIDSALTLGGTYYLPYHLIATQEQIEQAYPMFKEFVALKRKYDPQEMFSNKLYQKYAH